MHWLLRLLSFFHKAKTGRRKLTYKHLLLYALGDALENVRYRKGLSEVEVETLRRRLMNLAFHMTAAQLRRAEKEDVEEARVWMFRDHPIEWMREALQPKPELSAECRTQADRALALSREAGVLLPTADGIEFEHQLTQECFCVLYCLSEGVTEELLANATQRQFSEVWRLWAQQQPAVVDEVIAYLYPAWGELTMAHAAEVLGMIGDKRATEALLPLVRHRGADFVLRLAATYALGEIADPRAFQDLLDILRNEEESVRLRTQAAHALGRSGDLRAIGPLVELLRDNNPEITLAAGKALMSIGKPAAKVIVPVLGTMAAGIGFGDTLRILAALGGVDMKLLKFLAHKHEKDPEAARLIAQTESEVLAVEARKFPRDTK